MKRARKPSTPEAADATAEAVVEIAAATVADAAVAAGAAVTRSSEPRRTRTRVLATAGGCLRSRHQTAAHPLIGIVAQPRCDTFSSDRCAHRAARKHHSHSR